ncbi:MAG: peroxiredoxin [Spirochaetota bacterium]
MILFFYPGDFTFVCPTELKELSQFYDDFKNNNAEILSVSTDSVYVHKAWQESNDSLKDVKFPMLSDRAAALSKVLGVYDENTGEALRASFIVDPEGVVVAYEIHNPTIGRSAGELLRKLDAAIAVKKGGGGLCPASWKKGDALIKPLQ